MTVTARGTVVRSDLTTLELTGRDVGAFVARLDGTFAVDFAKIQPAVRDLVHDLLTIEATGDYAGAKKMLD